jgi:hypothetical protein
MPARPHVPARAHVERVRRHQFTGATPRQVAAGLSAAQVLPALAGAMAGLPGGFALFRVTSQGGSASQPPAWWLIVAVLGTVIAIAGLTAIPARVGARRPVTDALRAGTA